MTSATTRRARTGAALAAISLALLAGCAGISERSLGVDADDVASLEYYEYRWSEAPADVERLTIDDPEVLAEWVRAYTDMPVSDVAEADTVGLDGQQTQSSRFILTDGRRIEITTIWRGPKDVIVLWPDGTASHTTWGSPDLFDAYDEVGRVAEVSAAELPAAELPD
jgi:hypothetical protein